MPLPAPALIGICSVLAASGAIMLSSSSSAPPDGWAYPLAEIEQRDRLLTFGLHVTPDPATNPIDPPERFVGYHAALDFEILPGESDIDVPVFAACDGKVIFASNAEGYGGVIVQRCALDGEPVTVLYGHLDPASFAVNVEQDVARGERIASLAAHKSPGSGDTRKHLHLGIHRGEALELRGYVQEEEELEGFVDPEGVLRLQ
jgi:murein DD-endopeptidase MepM/ murein hydrolase activator NlpD